MPPIDHVPWRLGHRDIQYLNCMSSCSAQAATNYKTMNSLLAPHGSADNARMWHGTQGGPGPGKPSMCFRCYNQASCCCSPRRDVTHTFPRHKPPGVGQTKEIVVLTREHSHLKSLDERSVFSSSDAGCCDDGDEANLMQTVTHRLPERFRDNTSSSPHPPVFSSRDWLSFKHRSHSFTSATYQKIQPTLQPPGGKGLGKGSNYSVTLVVGDKPKDSSSISRSSEPPLLAFAGWQQDSHEDSSLRSYLSLPRPRNKSVFKKFFGK